ncbi:MAG TPA: S41 family peptidase [Patescibacteria group bacterium]|nr:S41 family peptidase [Patescibacteria group bacterium]
MNFLKKANGITIIIALLTFILGWQLGQRNFQFKFNDFRPKVSFENQSLPQDKNIDFKLFWQVWDLVSSEYVDKKAIEPQKMFYGAIAGMVAALGDPYTVFLPPEEQKSISEEINGAFEGVGIQLGYDKNKRLAVIAPVKDTPADRAGVKAGDLILKIGGKDAVNLSLPEAVNLIRGPKGTTIALEIYHDGDAKAKTIELKRDTIVVKSVELEEKTSPKGKKVSLIKLSRFGERTFSEWNQAVSDSLASAPQALILDLRNNPGGLLDGAVFIGSEFIKSGDIVLQENAKGEKIPYKVNREGKLLSLPLIVLINKGSASASEIVAGAVQDLKRGKLLGETSFGKGTIQESQDLPEKTGIHITTAKWLTPLGRWIHQIGLTPDIKVELTEDQLKAEAADKTKDFQLERALEEIDNF